MGTDATALAEAIRRIEAGETGRELDPIIATAAGRKARPSAGDWVVPFDEKSFERCPYFTSSIDDALTLVPEDHDWNVYVCCRGPAGNQAQRFEAVCVRATWAQPMASSPAFRAECMDGPAAALCLAALRARLAMLEAAP
jgi:hypothetical protein